jgi:putative transposase
VGEGGDEVSVARFIAVQRTFYRVPYAACCAILGVSISWLYKWLERPVTPGQQRRAELDAEVVRLFTASRRTYGSPRIHKDLLEAGWVVSVNTVAESMRRQGLQGRKPKHSKGLTKQDRKAPKFPDLLKRDFTAPAPNVKWCGDITEIPTDEGKLYLASVLDLFSRKLLACPTSEHPNALLACDAIKIAAATRGAGPRSTVSSSTVTAVRPTPRRVSPCYVRTNSVSDSRWEGSVRVSIVRV